MEIGFPTSFIFNGFPTVIGFTIILDETYIPFFLSIRWDLLPAAVTLAKTKKCV